MAAQILVIKLLNRFSEVLKISQLWSFGSFDQGLELIVIGIFCCLWEGRNYLRLEWWMDETIFLVSLHLGYNVELHYKSATFTGVEVRKLWNKSEVNLNDIIRFIWKLYESRKCKMHYVSLTWILGNHKKLEDMIKHSHRGFPYASAGNHIIPLRRT